MEERPYPARVRGGRLRAPRVFRDLQQRKPVQHRSLEERQPPTGQPGGSVQYADQYTPNGNRLLSSTDPSLDGLPYIFHACNEFYSNKMNPMPYKSTEASHVVGLRTSAEKLVYYINWYDGGVFNDPYTTSRQADPANFPSSNNAEYYSFNNSTGFVKDAYEITNYFNNANTHIANLQGIMQDLIASELQAPLPVIYYGVSSPDGLNLQSNVLDVARNSYVAYIQPPTNMVVSANQTPAPGATVTFSVTAGNVQPGPTLAILEGNLANGLGFVNKMSSNQVPEDAPGGVGNSQPYILTFPFPMSATGTYSVQLSNPSSSYSYNTYNLG